METIIVVMIFLLVIYLH